MFIPDPGSDFFPSRIPDPQQEFKYFNSEKWLLSSRKYVPGCSSRIPDPDPYFLPIPDLGSRILYQGAKKAPDPGSGSATLVRRDKNIIIFKNITCETVP
jgi:hypothetical protein